MRPLAPTFPAEQVSSSPVFQILAALSVVVATFGCAPQTPSEKASEAARGLNWAARWGKMEEAVELAAKSNKKTFRENRAEWQTEIRIVDSEVVSLNMKDATHATVEVDISWNFQDDPTLRLTRIKQDWADEGRWALVKEVRASGDDGLFGEEIKRLDKERDTHFPSRTIHASE